MAATNGAELIEQYTGAMKEHLYRRSVVLLLGDPRDSTSPGTGSGTCVQIGGRYLIGTAAHNLDDVNEAIQVGVAALGEIGKCSRQTPRVVGWGRRGGGDFDRLDLAWLELEPRAMPHWIPEWNRTFVTLDRISLIQPSLGRAAYLLGQPHDYRRDKAIAGVPTVGLHPLPYMAAVLSPQSPEEAARDVLMYYPSEMSSAEGRKSAPDPHGLSGCGLWMVNAEEGGVWTPDRAQLVGIQISARPQEWLRGNLMREWLRLVRDDIPDLRAEIDPVLEAP
jgi:hypothetical protein